MAIQQRNLEALSHFTLLATTAISGVGDQTGVDLAGYDGDVQIILVGTAAGSGADLTFRIEESDSAGSNYSAVSGGTFTAVGNAAYKEVLTLNKGGLKRYLRLSCTAETGTASSSITCVGFGVKKYMP
jgi:hypothetical protein